jgi:hypothetical protein
MGGPQHVKQVLRKGRLRSDRDTGDNHTRVVSCVTMGYGGIKNEKEGGMPPKQGCENNAQARCMRAAGRSPRHR